MTESEIDLCGAAANTSADVTQIRLRTLTQPCNDAETIPTISDVTSLVLKVKNMPNADFWLVHWLSRKKPVDVAETTIVPDGLHLMYTYEKLHFENTAHILAHASLGISMENVGRDTVDPLEAVRRATKCFRSRALAIR